mmetsp:Transcript_2547/g.2394  ORF Transcript_2547/g.2394 Transcript_2547/m.2394 type:complete len:99 (+) Transcript_2547:516-812(+)
MNDSKQSIYSTALSYGLPSDLVRESENLRDFFGRYRYIATAIPKFISPKKFPVYKSEVYYKLEDYEDQGTEDSNTEKDQRTNSRVNVPKVSEYKTKSN